MNIIHQRSVEICYLTDLHKSIHTPGAKRVSETNFSVLANPRQIAAVPISTDNRVLHWKDLRVSLYHPVIVDTPPGQISIFWIKKYERMTIKSQPSK